MKGKLRGMLFLAVTAMMSQPLFADKKADQLGSLASSAKDSGDLQSAENYLCQAADIDAKKYGKKCDRAKEDVANALAQFQADMGMGRTEMQRKDYPGALRDFGKINFGPNKAEAKELVQQIHLAMNEASADPASTTALRAARAAYIRGDFDTAEAQARLIRSPLLQAGANQLLTNIRVYRDTMKEADALAHSGDLKGAEQKYELAETIPGQPQDQVSAAALQAARSAYSRGDFDAVDAQVKLVRSPLLQGGVNQLLANISDYRDAMKQADALTHSGDLKGAEQKYQIAIRLQQNGPGQPQEHLLEVQAAEAQSEKSQTSKLTPASPQKKAAATVAPLKVNSDKIRDSLDTARRAEAQGDLKAALHAYDAALHLDKKQEEAIDGKKRVLEEMQEDPKAVEDNLVEGIADFYASRLSQANDAISAYLQGGGKHYAGAAHFYLGASLLTEAILTPVKDPAQGNALRHQAQDQFVLAKQLHYKPMKSAVSPKILAQWMQIGDQQ
jgi:hypothetical protein